MQTYINDNMKEEIIFQIKDLTKYYRCEDGEANTTNITNFLKRKEELVLKSISFDIYKSSIIGIVGNKKCGKSTLLKILSGIVKPTSGQILYKGSKLTDTQLREMVSYISKEQPSSQEYSCALFENVIQYACRDNKDRCEAVDKADILMKDFKMEEYRYKEVIKLPSSIRSKMFIIRGFLSCKPVLCFDQPFSFIGEDYREVFNKYIRESVQYGKTIIITSNDAASIEGICNEIINL